MRLLLDTSIVVPLAQRRISKLPPRIADLLRAVETRPVVSVVSLWEVAIKHRLGKLPLTGPLASLPELLSGGGIELLQLTPGQAIAEADPLPPTRDPFDRLLLAVCAVENMRLLSTDRALADHPLAWRPMD